MKTDDENWRLVAAAGALATFAIVALTLRTPIVHFFPTMTFVILFVVFVGESASLSERFSPYSALPDESMWGSLSLELPGQSIQSALQHLVDSMQKSMSSSSSTAKVQLFPNFFKKECPDGIDTSVGISLCDALNPKKIDADKLQSYVNKVAKIAEMFQYMSNDERFSRIYNFS